MTIWNKVLYDLFSVICGPGYEKKEEICVKCQKGFYKDTTGIGSCTACPALFSTSLEGAVSDTDCKVRKSDTFTKCY